MRRAAARPGSRRCAEAAALIGCAFGSACATRGPDLDAVAQRTRAFVGAPALGVLAGRSGAPPEIAVTGVRVQGADALAQADDAWHWGSITKSVTATLAARLVDQGLVTWDDSVERHLGSSIPDMRPEFRPVTLRHLLANAGGLPNNLPLHRFAEFATNPDDPIADRRRWVRLALRQPPVARPGERFDYSNNGFIVAAAMLEAVTGASWEELVQREVFEPLQMTGAGFGAPPGAAIRGHVRTDETPVPAPPLRDNPPALGPAGRIHMPLGAMARYLAAHADERADYLSADSWSALHTAHFAAQYGLRWFTTGETTRWHHGSNTMWYAEVAIDVRSGTFGAVVVNDGGVARTPDRLRELLDTLVEGGPPR